MKSFIQKCLVQKVHGLIAKHQPIIIGVTGSVGKTSTRDAIAALLSSTHDVAPNIKNYNNEFGLPLTILGKVSPGRSVFGWLSLLLSSPKRLHQVYVLEYAIDHPGDMDHLCEIVMPTVAVMTRISPVHAEFFRSIEELAEEKAKLIACVPEDGLVVLNADDPRVIGLSGHAQAPHVTYGFSSSADVHVVDYGVWTRDDFSFKPGELFSKMSFGIVQNEGRLDMEIKNVLGRNVAGSMAAAVAVARHLGVSDADVFASIPKVVFEPGRLNPIAGIKGSLILDGSYNAAPASMQAALETLAEFHPAQNARRIAVLGHMAELGAYTGEEHRQIGFKAAEVGVDVLVVVGEVADGIRHGAIEAGMSESTVEFFSDPVSAGHWLDAHVHTGDIVLVKGSQSARMEKVVKDLMAEPLRAPDLLVRQESYWLET
ncbi:hypothetical protein HZA85_04280 [Candidatus Uhrbacteria bacterium]|nr:hypothetical protein [Candidatus Uhrbacteria bacterium]